MARVIHRSTSPASRCVVFVPRVQHPHRGARLGPDLFDARLHVALQVLPRCLRNTDAVEQTAKQPLERVKRQIEAWANELIDLSRRNTSLYYRKTKGP